jgi:two-component system sensor histidine kinase BarA
LEELEKASDPKFFLVVNQLNEKLNQLDYKWRVILPPGSPLDRNGGQQTQDPFEIQLIDRWLQARPDPTADAKSPEYEERLVLGGDEYQYYQPVRAEGSCLLLCHKQLQPGWKVFGDAGPLGGGIEPIEEGDLMAVVQVRIPNAPAQAEIRWYWSMLLALAIITGFLAMIAFYVTIRYVIVKPLRHLREVSNAISHGNMAMRADIHTGDEYEALAVAFNRMLRQVNMQLYEMNRVKSDFMATMSHELRTPLNSILGFSDVLGSVDSLDDRQRRYVENIQKSGQMLLEMINNILDLAKIESGKVEVQPADFDVAQLVHTQCDMARPLTERKNIDLETQVQPNLPPLHQDQGRVHQILNNLLSNAIKFTPEGGRIRVTAARNARRELVLKVIDTGVGIAEEDQQTIFEKFRQGSTAMPTGDAITREYSGTGLGLSIVRELSKLLGGDVSVESALGTGSTFTVRLPWKLDRQPRLDSPLAAGLEEFTRPRLDARGGASGEPLSVAGKPSASGDRT